VLLVCTVYSVLYSEIAVSRKPFGIGHIYIYTFFLLRMADTMTSQSTDLSSCDTLYMRDIVNFEVLSEATMNIIFRQRPKV
jgi:hypothetical protein